MRFDPTKRLRKPHLIAAAILIAFSLGLGFLLFRRWLAG